MVTEFERGMIMEENKIITMLDEDGEKIDFELIEIIELDEKKYALLAPIGEDDDAFVYKIEVIDGKEQYIAVEDEEEFERVLEEYDSTFEE
ncbi:DUF1292 domain-containing protein [Clostridium lacusfryxellense]|uniref:DUF1292 domain-containing protein n=1 Tax=Clostridium lacusfryxellense TaxID=205328 RepID=UPI001C0C8425|nr:DUF1292 domain-containing protein [Clostridium lacusfryxellense]MBU3111863.1 DUF1292 domain-containing protein [Clostridium lacusfryxellense]